MGSPSALEPKTQRRWGLSNGKLLLVDEDVEDLAALFRHPQPAWI